jgi:hypothetical protein
MRSVLPESYVAAGKAISKSHNIRVLMLMLALLASLVFWIPIVSMIAPISHRRDLAIAYLLLIGFGVFFGIYRIAQHDKAKCYELGYVCPHCGHPLYSSKGFEKITGRCPACTQRVA